MQLVCPSIVEHRHMNLIVEDAVQRMKFGNHKPVCDLTVLSSCRLTTHSFLRLIVICNGQQMAGLSQAETLFDFKVYHRKKVLIKKKKIAHHEHERPGRTSDGHTKQTVIIMMF